VTTLPDIGKFERTMITIAVMIGTFLQVLDTTIANVALPHMQTSLGANRETINWVLTSYIVASAIAIPITGWLADRIGRKRLFVISTVAFTASSALCAGAQGLDEMLVFRALQGVAGAFLVPLAQSVLFDINRPEQHAKAMALFGGGIMIAPILGPVLGGWLTESFNWRWVFLVNVPIGAIATVMLVRYLPSAEIRKRQFDLFGFALLALALASFQLMLDRGQQLDWFDSWEIWIECFIAISAAWMFVVHMLQTRAPLIEPHLFADRNFVVGLVFMLVTGLLLMAGLALLPPLLQNLYGYSVLQSGFLTAPRGVGTLVSMLLAGQLVGKVDTRMLILAGLGLLSLSLWQMAGFALDMDRQPIIVSGFIQGLGLGFVFVPLQTLAFSTLAGKDRTTAASLLNLTRSIGGSIGISVVSVLLVRNAGTSHADLAGQVTMTDIPGIPPSLAASGQMIGPSALQMLEAEINRQSLMIAYIDNFHFMMLVTLAAVPLLLLIRSNRRRVPNAFRQR
jgi:MFS transporter, DHA2 family, multidrug resistance protein